MNTVHLMGYLARDVELRYGQSGSAVANTAIGYSEKWKSKDGEQKEHTSFFELTFFGRTAEVASEWFSKGSPIVVVGHLRQDKWEDSKTGEPRYKVHVVVDRLHFVPKSKEKKQPEGKAAKPRAKVDRETAEAVAAGFPDEHDDVPF